MTKTRAKDPRRVNDYWTRKAKAENYPARSVYKLEEIDAKHGLLRPGQRVLDLGASPGSWSLYAAGKVGAGGCVVGLDLKPLEGVTKTNIDFMVADVYDISPESLTAAGLFDAVLSDMAPATTGIKSTDQVRSEELARAALDMARRVLKGGGSFLVKIFQGPDVDQFFKEVKAEFREVKRLKPKSSRSISPEIFILGLGFKNRGEEIG